MANRPADPLPHRLDRHGWLLALLVFLILAVPRLQQPVTDDEIYEVRNAERLLVGEQIHLYLPPLYDLVLAGAIYVAGNGDAALRGPGIVCALVSMVLTWVLARQLGLTQRQRSLSLLLLATAPAFVQGSLLVHIDNTLLVPTCLAFIVTLLAWQANQDQSRHWGFLCAACLALALLTKISTPLLMVVGIGLAFLWKDRARVLGFSAITLGGVAGFVVMWWLMAGWLQLDPLDPFRFVAERADRQRADWLVWVATCGRNGWTLAAWFGPWVLLGGLASLRHLNRLNMAQMIVVAAALGVFVYFPLTAINHGFPKYYLPALPLILLVLVRTYDWQLSRTDLILIAGVTLFLLLVGHEPVYFLRFEVRRLLVAGTSPIVRILQHALLWVTPAVALILLRGWDGGQRLVPNLGRGLLVLCLASGLSLSVQQTAADYQTNYSYGEQETSRLVGHLRSQAAEHDGIIATQDILYRLGRHHQALADTLWRSPAAIAARIEAVRTRFVVVSLPSQSTALVGALAQSPLSDALAAFDPSACGTHTLYTRRTPAP